MATSNTPIDFEELYVETFRLAWDDNGVVATPEVANSVLGHAPQPGSTGDNVTINGPVRSIVWFWEPQTAPIVDPNDTSAFLLPTVKVNQRFYIANLDDLMFPQIQSYSINSDKSVDILGDWEFTAYNGAYIEIVVLRSIV
jgi:hypothetical protein